MTERTLSTGLGCHMQVPVPPACFDDSVDEVHGGHPEGRESAKGISLCGDLPLLVAPACS